jgi:predicted acetyltransferase
VELFNLAFPGERTVEERARGLEGGGVFGGLETTYLAELEGVPAGAFRAYRFTLHLHGRRWPTLGLAAVAVSPSFRRRGIGRWMCREALRVGRERGDLLSALFPFRVSFYAGLGYALAGSLHRYRFPLHDLPVGPGWERVRWMPRGEDAVLREVYARVAARSNGLLERTERMWGFLNRERYSAHVYVDDRGRARGYLVAAFRRGRTGTVLGVKELVAEDQDAYEGLLGWIAAQRDQAAEGVLDTLPSEGFHRRLAHPRRPRTRASRGLWFESATLLRGPMLRVLDPPGVLAACGAGVGGGELPDDDDPVAVAGFTEGFLEGRLPGMKEPEGWEPARGVRDFVLLDDF